MSKKDDKKWSYFRFFVTGTDGQYNFGQIIDASKDEYDSYPDHNGDNYSTTPDPEIIHDFIPQK